MTEEKKPADNWSEEDRPKPRPIPPTPIVPVLKEEDE